MLGKAQACQSSKACQTMVGCVREFQSMSRNARDANMCHIVPRDCDIPGVMACQDVKYAGQLFYGHDWT